ncbi:hypothetical protein JCM21900_004963 [Sporobolomyces salmonicolor]
MSKPGRGFFDDDDDDAPESYPTSHLAADDSLSSTGQLSPRRYASTPAGLGGAAAPRLADARASTATTGGRVSSITGPQAGSSARAYESTRGESLGLDEILGEDRDLARERNVQRLLRAWTNEMGAPELLTFPRELVERVVKDLARRKAIVRRAQSTSGQDEAFYTTAAVVATENMRAAHVLKMFARERIHKLEHCAEYYLSLADVRERLYPNEIAHAEGYLRLVKAYHDTAAMDAMPEQVTRNPPPMPTPDFSKPVFFRARRDCPPVVLPDGEAFVFTEGSQHMCRYSTIRALLEKGDVELI